MLPLQELTKLFGVLDEDASGSVGIDELTRFVWGLGTTRQQPASPISSELTSVAPEPESNEQLGEFELTPTVERHIVKIQAAIRGKAVRTPPGMPSHSSDEDDQAASPDGVEATAVASQATERLALSRPNHVDLSGDIDVAEWLVSQNAEDLIDKVKDDFGVTTLRDLIAVVQEPQDWSIFVPDDEARCKSLWASMQEE